MSSKIRSFAVAIFFLLHFFFYLFSLFFYSPIRDIFNFKKPSYQEDSSTDSSVESWKRYRGYLNIFGCCAFTARDCRCFSGRWLKGWIYIARDGGKPGGGVRRGGSQSTPPWGFRLWASRRWATNREGRSTSSTLPGEVIIPVGYGAVKRRSVKTCLPAVPLPFALIPDSIERLFPLRRFNLFVVVRSICQFLQKLILFSWNNL